MSVRDLLQNRKTEILSEMERLKNEAAEIEAMLSVKQPVTAMAGAANAPLGIPPEAEVPATKDDAIIHAIAAGNSTPATISQWMRDRLGADVNDASTRTRLSRMKASGKIAHDATGWKLPQK
ncbi:hypothetical protein [Rhizobium leguminosarum]|jgi:hypothetical protein|uniref:hypothetical protein n=1 Tax=Rhizobium leguminosarum TaxID=384 RepID=UPI001441C123|nr:hypothetical protein [Rhizobium leguminosarum]MBY5863249.1 hypothetical protein [Rhizobium leguminosarum]NKM04127.1 hypothetical protein [Rhizobium leguminosarum bv. viciae]